MEALKLTSMVSIFELRRDEENVFDQSVHLFNGHRPIRTRRIFATSGLDTYYKTNAQGMPKGRLVFKFFGLLVTKSFKIDTRFLKKCSWNWRFIAQFWIYKLMNASNLINFKSQRQFFENSIFYRMCKKLKSHMPLKHYLQGIFVWKILVQTGSSTNQRDLIGLGPKGKEMH